VLQVNCPLTLLREPQQSVSCSQPNLIWRVQRQLPIISSKHPEHHSMREHLPCLPEPAAFQLACRCHFAPAELRCICACAHYFAEGLADARLHCSLRH
jgi:hypothetical protein